MNFVVFSAQSCTCEANIWVAVNLGNCLLHTPVSTYSNESWPISNKNTNGKVLLKCNDLIKNNDFQLVVYCVTAI